MLSQVAGPARRVARRFQTLKEDAKHHSLAELAVLRRALLTLDRRFDLDGAHLLSAFRRIVDARQTNAARCASWPQAGTRRALWRCASCIRCGTLLTAHDLEAASAGDSHEVHAMSGVIRGTRVSGSTDDRGPRPRDLRGGRRERQSDGRFPRRRHHRRGDDQPGVAALFLARRRLRQRGRRMAQPPRDPGARVRCAP